MTGLTGLVPAAELLAELGGSRDAAAQLALAILVRGVDGLPRGRDDVHSAARDALRSTGVVSESGVAELARAAELVVVCEVLAASSTPHPAPPPEARLVFSAPRGSVAIADYERLELLVVDVIRRATTTLHIGGAFWNDAGFDVLETVLVPAVAARGVTTRLYVHPPKADYMDALQARLTPLCAAGPLTVRWFAGPAPTMLHAKFVVADKAYGYLGTANLTSWGMGAHVEAGVELTQWQSKRFVQFLDDLDGAGFFEGVPPA